MGQIFMGTFSHIHVAFLILRPVAIMTFYYLFHRNNSIYVFILYTLFSLHFR